MPVTIPSFIDSTVENNRVYYYAVTAVSGNNESARSLEVKAIVGNTLNGPPAAGDHLNRPPEVHAVGNQTLILPATAALSATASDDGLPNGVLSYEWSV